MVYKRVVIDSKSVHHSPQPLRADANSATAWNVYSQKHLIKLSMRPKTTIKIVKSGRACCNSEMEKGKPLGFESNVQSD